MRPATPQPLARGGQARSRGGSRAPARPRLGARPRSVRRGRVHDPGLRRAPECRRSQPPLGDATDPEWVLFARLALAGARIVSVPEALAAHAGRPGRVGDVPGDGLAVLAAFEERAPADAYDLPQLAATLAASLQRIERERPATDGARQGLVDRGLDVLRAEGVAGLARRARARLR